MIEAWIERLFLVIGLLLGGGGIFAWRYSKRSERAKVENIEVDVDLKQLQLINQYMATITQMSTEIDTALITISMINRDLMELKTKFVALKRVAQKLYEESKDRVALSDSEIDLLKSGDTGDIYKPRQGFDKK